MRHKNSAHETHRTERNFSMMYLEQENERRCKRKNQIATVKRVLAIGLVMAVSLCGLKSMTVNRYAGEKEDNKPTYIMGSVSVEDVASLSEVNNTNEEESADVKSSEQSENDRVNAELDRWVKEHDSDDSVVLGDKTETSVGKERKVSIAVSSDAADVAENKAAVEEYIGQSAEESKQTDEALKQNSAGYEGNTEIEVGNLESDGSENKYYVDTDESKDVVLGSYGTGYYDKGSFKAYMDRSAITNKKSMQWQICSQGSVDEYGIYELNGRYLVAVGSGHQAGVGININVTLSSGNVLRCTVGDIKQDRHTDKSNTVCRGNGSVIEFIVDTDKLSKSAKSAGDISEAGEIFEGTILLVEIVE